MKQAMTKIAQPSEQGDHDVGQRLGPVLRIGEGAAREGADVGQHGVDHKEQHTRDDACPDRSADHGAVLLHAPGADVQADDNAEDQRRDGIHGVVSR